jgi:Fe-S-cluster containining protein
MSEETDADYSSTCTQCAICCDGTLYGSVEVDAESVETLLARGANLDRDGEKYRFKQPCAFSVACHCTVYDHRPLICRNYSCLSLDGVRDGQIAIEELLARIAAVKQTLARIRALLLPGETLVCAKRRCQAAAQDPAQMRNVAPLAMELGILTVQLDRHFRHVGSKTWLDQSEGSAMEVGNSCTDADQ